MAVSHPDGEQPKVNTPTPTAVWQLGADGVIRRRNRAAAEICGEAGVLWRDSWPETGRAAADAALAAALGGDAAGFRAEVAWGASDKAPVEVSVTALFGPDGTLEGFSASARDMTRELDAASVLADIGQEIRTPLHGLVAGTAILEARALSQPERELAGMLRVSALSLTDKLRPVLELALAGRERPLLDPALLGDPAQGDGIGPGQAPVAQPGPPQILVADDHPTNLRLVELILDDMACVRTVGDGREAIEAFAEQPFDLVLMDVQMPVLDGVSAVSEIRRYEALHNRRRTPIAMLTANADPDNVAASRAAGADHHIAKPFTPDLLVRCVQALLRGAGEADPTALSWPPSPTPPSPYCAA